MKKTFLIIIPFFILAILFFYSSSSQISAVQSENKLVLLGIDGLDPNIVEYLVRDNRLPNIQRMMKTGTYEHLKTSCPPQSPVAWSDFIVGGDPGNHGIFDFIHRNPGNYMPLMSTSEARDPENILKIGRYRIPLSQGSVELFRRGKPFWQYLEEAGIYCTIFKLPSNFPPVEMKHGLAFSGMGTPDLLGTSGTFYLFSDKDFHIDEDIAGGEVFVIDIENHHIKTEIVGPPNTLIAEPDPNNPGRERHPELKIPMDIYLDPVEDIIEINIQESNFLLKKGQFSDWVELRFDVIPHVQSVSAIVKFYLIEKKPDFKLYMSPMNLNPADSALPIASPASFGKKIVEEFGYFYTQNMPEDTKAYSNKVFNTEDYIRQADMVFEENINLYRYFLDNFKEGFLFYYFSTLDQNSHMLWQLADVRHPAHIAEYSEKYGFYIDTLEGEEIPYFLDYDKREVFSGHPYLFEIYERIDEEIGYALDTICDNTTLLIISDHGFAPYYRSVNLNTLLYDNGYITLIDESRQGIDPFFRNVNWRRTQAYAIGLNGLYINLRGRERDGTVRGGAEYDRILREIKDLLLEATDPATGDKIISNVYITKDVYSGRYKDMAPDIIVGYASGFRASWETALGKIPTHFVRDNTDPWSGDHCMDPEFLSGVFLTNKKVSLTEYSLRSMADFILSEFQVKR